MWRPLLLGVAFLISGASALVFETLWFHQASIALGSSAWSASLVLSAFMAGMACGNWLAARRAAGWRDPLLAYARIEFLVAVAGVALVFGLPEIGRACAPLAEPLAAWPWLLDLIRLVVAFALMCVPSAAMGMTLPLLVHAVGPSIRQFGRVLGLLYGINTLGAVLGAVLAEVLLLERFGVRGTALCAGALNIAAALAAMGLARAPRSERVPVPPQDAGTPAEVSGAALRPLVAVFLSGFALLALEVVWLRFLMLFLNDTPLAFAMVLALVLTGIALGGMLGGLLTSLSPRAADYTAVAAYATGVLGLLGYLIYPRVLAGAFPPYQPAATILAIAAPLVLPAALASGCLFTLLGAALRRVSESGAAASGHLSFASTVGAGLGPLVATFALLPHLGMERSLLTLFALYGAIGLLLGAAALPRTVRYASPVLFAACLAAFPFGAMRDRYIRASASRWTQGDAELVQVRESSTATLLHVVQRHAGAPLFDQLATNAYSMSVNGFAGRRYMELFAYLPFALHPRIERALVVGFGLGNTAGALTDSAELARIDIADVSPDMLDQSRKLVTGSGRHPLDDPRVAVHIEDGRFFLQSTSGRFDLITGEPPPPIMAGVVNLYTAEYFALMRSRLAPGGIATYWLPVINISGGTALSVIRAFCDAFSDCTLWRGSGRNLMLMGTRDLRDPVPLERFSAQWRDPRVRAELEAVGFEQPAQLGALFVGDADYLRELSRDAPPLTDDQPKRMQQRGSKEERDALLATLLDARAASERFARSAFIAAHWPAELREPTRARFQDSWLIDELLSPRSTPLRDLRVLHQVMRFTDLRLPVLLLLGSDPDEQRALARLSPAARDRPEWVMPRIAGLLADRDFAGALTLLERSPRELEPLPQLREYVQTAIAHAR